MSKQCKRLVVAFALLAVCGAEVIAPAPAAAQSVSTLRRRAADANSRLKKTRARLRKIKEQQARAGDELSAAQRQLEMARQRLAKADKHLKEVRQQLEKIKLKLEATRAMLKQHSEAMGARILAQWRAGQPSFLEVVLEATDFQDFANRAYFTRRLAGEDQRMLTELVATKRQEEQQQALLERKEQQAAELVVERKKEEAEVKARTNEVRALVHKLKTDRAMAEQAAAAEQEEYAALSELIRRRTGSGSSYAYSGRWSGSFLKPAAGRISSPFGMRYHPILHVWKMHNGVDIANAAGTTIRAAAKGRVIYTGWRSSWSGNTVIIDHGSGCQTVYCHIRPGGIKCRVGQVVERGQKIAEMGTTGLSTGNHLHFGCKLNGRWVNPMKYKGP